MVTLKFGDIMEVTIGGRPHRLAQRLTQRLIQDVSSPIRYVQVCLVFVVVGVYIKAIDLSQSTASRLDKKHHTTVLNRIIQSTLFSYRNDSGIVIYLTHYFQM